MIAEPPPFRSRPAIREVRVSGACASREGAPGDKADSQGAGPAQISRRRRSSKSAPSLRRTDKNAPSQPPALRGPAILRIPEVALGVKYLALSGRVRLLRLRSTCSPCPFRNQSRERHGQFPEVPSSALVGEPSLNVCYQPIADNRVPRNAPFRRCQPTGPVRLSRTRSNPEIVRGPSRSRPRRCD
jgi:hypothetical protein